MQFDFVRSARLGTVSLLVGLGAIALAGARIVEPSNGDNHRGAEVQRLRAHFDSVDSELRARDVSRLNSSQLTQRKQLIAWLVEYRNAGVFPVNDRFPGRMVPFFRDSKGTLCAMAYLIDRSGRGDLVDRIAQTQNNAFIPDLAGDPELEEWLKSVGLTVSEAARIQPAYDGPGFPGYDPDKVGSDFAIASLLLGGGSLAGATVNVISPSVASEVGGILIGVGAIIHGMNHLDQNRGTKRVANATIITGSASLAASVGAFLLSQARKHSDRVSNDGNRRTARLMITPALVPAATQYRLGLAGSATF
jgi:hypothetical protein